MSTGLWQPRIARLRPVRLTRLVLWGACALLFLTQNEPGHAAIFNVPAQSGCPLTTGSIGWTNTGIMVNPNDTVIICATGLISVSSGGPEWGPGGETGDIAGAGFCLQGTEKSSLIAKVGGTLFPVGVGATITAPAAGPVLLGVNDQFYTDNSGRFVAVVGAGPSKAAVMANQVFAIAGTSTGDAWSYALTNVGAGGPGAPPNLNVAANLGAGVAGVLPVGSPPASLAAAFAASVNGLGNDPAVDLPCVTAVTPAIPGPGMPPPPPGTFSITMPTAAPPVPDVALWVSAPGAPGTIACNTAMAGAALATPPAPARACAFNPKIWPVTTLGIPALSAWRMAVLSLLLVAAGLWLIARRRMA